MNATSIDIDAILRDPIAATGASGGGVGFVGLDFPQDVAFALPVPCLHLPWRADGATTFADQWLESSFPGWSRSILEDWSAGRFDALDTVVFSRGDDASQRLYYYVRELQRRGRLGGPEPRILDVARIPRATSRNHTRAALASVTSALGLDDDALRRGIARANALRATFASLSERRASNGATVHRLARASLFADVSSAAPDLTGPVPRLRVLLAGSAPPDERLHLAVTRGGGEIVGETHGYGLHRPGPVLDANDDPLSQIARALHEAPGPRSFADPAALLATASSSSRADAVVLWLTREDEALAWHVPAVRRAFGDRQVPLLELTARHWSADDGALDEIEAFVARNVA